MGRENRKERSMKLRKVFFPVTLLILCLWMMSGCTEKEEVSEPEVELELMMHKREDMESMQKLVDAFEASQNRIRIRVNMVPNVDMELRVRAVEGTLPDLIQLNGLQARETMEFVQGGYLTDLSGEPFMEQVKDELLPYLKYEEQLFLFPMTLSYEGIFVNEKLLDIYGYEIPDTFEELMQTAENLEEQGEIPFLFADGDGWSTRMTWEGIETAMRGTCAEFWEKISLGETSFEEDALTRECLEILNEIHRYGQENSSETTYDEAVERFAAGEAAFFPQGSWSYQAMKQENSGLQVQLIPFPVPEGQEQKVTFWVDSNLAVTKQSAHAEEAMEFLEFIADPEHMEIYTSAQNAFSCLEGIDGEVSYAEELEQRREHITVVYEAVGLPWEVAQYRDYEIRSVLGGGEEWQSYLRECTSLLREYGEAYRKIKEKTG